MTAAPTAPWRPAQTTLTTAALAWRLQFLIWTRTTRTSTTRTTTKISLPAPRHSNKHSPSEHLHHGENSPVFMCACVCFFAPPPSPPSLVPIACLSVWLFSGVSMNLSCSWSTCTVVLRGDAIHRICSVCARVCVSVAPLPPLESFCI